MTQKMWKLLASKMWDDLSIGNTDTTVFDTENGIHIISRDPERIDKYLPTIAKDYPLTWKKVPSEDNISTEYFIQ